ncbi:MAG: glycoside hydrolase family 27 protein [Bryobacteraceae bacterium]
MPPLRASSDHGHVGRLATIFLAASLCLADATLTGEWKVRVQYPDGAMEFPCYLRITASEVAGYAIYDGMPWPIVDGSVSGQNVSFVIARKLAGDDRPITLRGTVEEGRLRLSFQKLNDANVYEATAVRVSASAPGPIPKLPERLRLASVPPLAGNGLARTPPMGWNSWNLFADKIDDRTVREIADALVSSGMAKAGYVYVNIDDTWEGSRDASGTIHPNQKFPDMRGLAAYVHSKGMKLGIYSSPARKTCAGYEGSFGHEEQDARTFASWGIDYLKYDWCSADKVYEPESMRPAYAIMGRALRETGRAIVFSLCQYGLQNVGEWGAEAGGNLWRTTGDISDTWASMSRIGFELQSGREKYASPGHWNDPDMLEIGNGGMSETEYRTHMSLWCMLAAPLIAGNDVRTMSPAIRDILTNPEVIAVDQDALGRQGRAAGKDAEIWLKELSGGQYAVALFNRGAEKKRMSVRWTDLGLTANPHVRDLWTRRDLGRMASGFSAEVPSHGVILLRVGHQGSGASSFRSDSFQFGGSTPSNQWTKKS